MKRVSSFRHDIPLLGFHSQQNQGDIDKRASRQPHTGACSVISCIALHWLAQRELHRLNILSKLFIESPST